MPIPPSPLIPIHTLLTNTHTHSQIQTHNPTKAQAQNRPRPSSSSSSSNQTQPKSKKLKMNSNGASTRDSASNDLSTQRDALPEHESRSGETYATALTVCEHYRGLHPDHVDLMADTSITTDDEFEQGMIQRGYQKNDQGRWLHPQQQAVSLPQYDGGDDSEDEGALTVGDHDDGLHPDHSDLMADTSITTADEFEQGLIQRGYQKNNQGRWLHPQQQAASLPQSDDGDDSEDEGALTAGDHDGGLHPDHSDLMADTIIATVDEFEQGLIQRGYKKDDRGRWLHPQQQAAILLLCGDDDDSEDEGTWGECRAAPGS